jgi:hypothetical protein
MDFYKYLNRDFSSQPYLFTFCASKLASKWAKSAGNSNFFQKVSTKISIFLKNHGYLDLSRWSRLVSTILIKILTKPSLDIKNLDREKKNWSRLILDGRMFSFFGRKYGRMSNHFSFSGLHTAENDFNMLFPFLPLPIVIVKYNNER